MLFNSLAFLLFFPVTTILFFLLPHKVRWLLLLAASCFFYMFFKPIYILILGFTIVIDYYAGILLYREQRPAKRKFYLIISLVANIGVLAIFKYYNFINHNISVLTFLFHVKDPLPILRMALPIGLSFHTFQAMSYTIEIYRGRQRAERHFGIYALYVMFYPQLVAGPIERPQNMIHQFHERKYFTYRNAVDGLRLMLWGMFKKVVIADRLALVTDPVFNNPHSYTATSLLLAAVLFSFQIFCDFSAYSEIAVGCARVMGFDLMRNFKHPYKAKTVAEFWRGWHISLSTWFKDYLYIPLGGSRKGMYRTYLNILCVFVISGLWHGANWTFIAWGLLHAIYMIFAELTLKPRLALTEFLGLNKLKRLNTILQQLITFTLITVAWIVFRANSIWDAIYIFRKLPGIFTENHLFIKAHITSVDLGVPCSQLCMCLGLILLIILVQGAEGAAGLNNYINTRPKVLRWGVYYLLTCAIIYLGIFQNRQFIYFQF